MSKYSKCHPSETAKSFQGLTDTNLYFRALCNSEPEFVQQSNLVYRYKDYFINVGKRFLMAGHGEGLMGLNRLELSCLPQGIALIWLDNDEDMLLITRIRGSEGHRLMPYSDHMSEPSVQAKQRLLADMDRLLEENDAVLAVTEGKDSWHILEGDGRIILSYCKIVFVSDKAKPAYRSRVLETLGPSE